MRLINKTSLALLGLAAMAPAALADGREPGSVLVYPVVQSQLGTPAVFNVISVTNTNRAGSGETDVHFEYVNVSTSGSPFLFANCTIADRVETLTPADTLSVLTSCHNGGASPSAANGYLVVSAMDPNAVDTYWSFNHLIGSEQYVSANGGMFSLNAIPFNAEGAEGSDTDLDNDGRRDFDGLEYEGVADELYIDAYVGVLGGNLALISMTGGEFLTNVDFIIYNDDEFQLSAQYSFSCWTNTPLADISGFFTDAGLNTTVNDTRELDINCDGLDDVETGWAIVRPTTALSITSGNINNPAVLGALVNTDPGTQFENGRLLWESVAKQLNGQFPN